MEAREKQLVGHLFQDMFPWPLTVPEESPSSCGNCFSPTADSAGVSAQIGSGVGGSEEVSRGFRENSARAAKAPGKVPVVRAGRVLQGS